MKEGAIDLTCVAVKDTLAANQWRLSVTGGLGTGIDVIGKAWPISPRRLRRRFPAWPWLLQRHPC